MSELETLRASYRRHREALTRMAAEAPTEALAQEYKRLLGAIDNALAKLEELDGNATIRLKTDPATTPLIQPIAEPVYDDEDTHVDYEPPAAHPVSNVRLALIVCAGVLVLAAIAWLIWRASSDRGSSARTGTVAEAPSATATTATETDTIAPAGEPPPAPSPITVSPQAHDYGAIRKGTRATRQFEIANRGATPLQVAVARSNCRCLYYEYRNTIPAKGKETLTVTIDGAKAPAGTLSETIRITAKNDENVAAAFDVTATIR